MEEWFSYYCVPTVDIHIHMCFVEMSRCKIK